MMEGLVLRQTMRAAGMTGVLGTDWAPNDLIVSGVRGRQGDFDSKAM